MLLVACFQSIFLKNCKVFGKSSSRAQETFDPDRKMWFQPVTSPHCCHQGSLIILQFDLLGKIKRKLDPLVSMVRYEMILSGTWWYWVNIGHEGFSIWLGVTDPRLTHSRTNFERENRRKVKVDLSFTCNNIYSAISFNWLVASTGKSPSSSIACRWLFI